MSTANALLAPFACIPGQSRGRQHPEPESATRSPFQRDRDRIIHCAAFRRLKYKTQVFVYHEGDYYRTRLTHSLEVSQIARSIARALEVNEDLAEAVALAHDLGHTPFGHAGEDALNEELQPYGGFDHNIQCLRIVTLLERCYAEFDGLNLTWEALEGIAKHNGPLSGPQAAPNADAHPGLPSAAAVAAVVGMDLELHTWPGLEAQVAALADDIAYNNHDIDDGLRAGLFTIADLDAVPLVGPAFGEVADLYPNIERPRLIHEAVRRLIDRMVNDLLAETRRRLAEAAPESADAVRQHDGPLVAFSESMRVHDKALKAFLFQRMYRHHRVNRMASKARRVVRELFHLFLAEPEILPDQWRQQTDGMGTPRTARTVADYLAGMTDRYALDEYARLFDVDKKA